MTTKMHFKLQTFLHIKNPSILIASQVIKVQPLCIQLDIGH